MRRIILFLSVLSFSSCVMDEDWSQHFYNNSDYNMYFYLHYYVDGKVSYPAYDELSTKPYLVLIMLIKKDGRFYGQLLLTMVH